MKEYYYWSVIGAAVLTCITAIIFTIIVVATGLKPFWMVILIVLLAIYVIVGAFIEGRDRDF